MFSEETMMFFNLQGYFLEYFSQMFQKVVLLSVTTFLKFLFFLLTMMRRVFFFKKSPKGHEDR